MTIANRHSSPLRGYKLHIPRRPMANNARGYPRAEAVAPKVKDTPGNAFHSTPSPWSYRNNPWARAPFESDFSSESWGLGVFHAVKEDFTKAAVFQKASVSVGSLAQEFPKDHTSYRIVQLEAAPSHESRFYCPWGLKRREQEDRKNFTVFLHSAMTLATGRQLFLQGNMAFPSCWSGDLPLFVLGSPIARLLTVGGKALVTPMHPPHAQGGKPKIMDSKTDGHH